MSTARKYAASTASLIEKLQASMAHHVNASATLKETLEVLLKESQHAVLTSNRILASCSTRAGVQNDHQKMAAARSLVNNVSKNDQIRPIIGVSKGSNAKFWDGRENFEIVVIEVVSSDRAIVRIMEGPLAGEEIEAALTDSIFEYFPSPSTENKRSKPQLRLIVGRLSSEGQT